MLSLALDSFRAVTAPPARPPLRDERNIRLLQIIPDATQPPGFWISLQCFPVDQAPPFDVLSYTRGPKYHSGVVQEWETIGICQEFSAYKTVQAKQEVARGSSLVNQLGSLMLNSVVPETTPTTIRVNKSQLDIHSDVLGFLKHANEKRMFWPHDLKRAELDSKMDEKPEEVWLWVDDVCVNDKDDGERGQQMTLLGEIYKRAQRTIVWLSEHEPPPRVDWLLTVLAARLLQLNKACEGDGKWGFDPESTRSSMWALVQDVLPEFVAAMLHFMSLIARHKYFDEGWMQEVLMTRRADVVCGSKTWDWAVFERFVLLSHSSVEILRRSATVKAHRILLERWKSLVWTMRDYSFVRQWWIDGGSEARRSDLVSRLGELNDQEFEYQQIAEMVRVLKGKPFEDKRDNIYGWMALTSLALPRGKRFGRVDYKLPTQVVYLRFTQSLLKGMPNLDVLNLVERERGEKYKDGIPSWVPDYSVKSLPYPLLAGLRLPKAGSWDFDATLSRTRSYPRTLEFDQDKLVVSGIKIDGIRNRGPSFIKDRGLAKLIPPEWFLQRCLEMGEYKYTRESVQEALCNTLGLGRVKTQDGSFEETWECFWGEVLRNRRENIDPEGDKTLLALPEKVYTSGSGTKLIPRTVEQSGEEETPANEKDDKGVNKATGLERATLMMRSMQLMLWHRAPYVSQQGCWGLCHASSGLGDEIWLLDGGRTPYMLQKLADGRYKFKGETYLHGWMFGEHLTGNVGERRQRITIV
ncbi:hypothetical protein B0I35DRAFT_418994 [Stachybotrys elegans]|uniref:Heterokaryon incompatibility domain-containing protein n=1 Tax=Stachybotrys elegans TaxID=80388 RepID=A0A8K0WX89_9HYPO|nr:hypothetical protein B0I35DRAFT_418994 [Stachybotrys elegans]